MPTSKIGLHDLDPSLFETLSNISGSNSQTKIFPLQVVASEDNQTIFPIGLDTFDSEKDFAFVQSGVTNLFYGADFTIENKNIILNEGVPAGRTLGIYVLKNVAPLDEEDYVSGTNLAPGSVTPDKIGGVLPIEKGGTGAATAEEACGNIGALPLTGGNLEGDLGVKGGYGQVYANETSTRLGSRNTPNNEQNYRQLIVCNSNNDSSIKNALELKDITNGVDTYYKIFGEHNPPTAEQVNALPLTGGTLSGSIYIKSNGYPHYVLEETTSGRAGFMEMRPSGALWNINKLDNSNLTALYLNPEGSSSLLKLRTLQNNVDNYYDIFGTHNKDLLKSVIQEMITNGEIQTGGESVIRKITRGTASVNGDLTISCSITDPSKVVVLLDPDTCVSNGMHGGNYQYAGFGAGSASVYLKSVSTTGIVVSGRGFTFDYSSFKSSSITFSYQIIEYM